MKCTISCIHILSGELFYGHSEILSVWSVNDVPEYLPAAHLQMFLRGVPAQEDGHEGDEGGAQPGRGDHAHGRVGVHEVVVVEWFADGVEPAQCCNMSFIQSCD